MTLPTQSYVAVVVPLYDDDTQGYPRASMARVTSDVRTVWCAGHEALDALEETCTNHAPENLPRELVLVVKPAP